MAVARLPAAALVLVICLLSACGKAEESASRNNANEVSYSGALSRKYPAGATTASCKYWNSGIGTAYNIKLVDTSSGRPSPDVHKVNGGTEAMSPDVPGIEISIATTAIGAHLPAELDSTRATPGIASFEVRVKKEWGGALSPDYVIGTGDDSSKGNFSLVLNNDGLTGQLHARLPAYIGQPKGTLSVSASWTCDRYSKES